MEDARKDWRGPLAIVLGGVLILIFIGMFCSSSGGGPTPPPPTCPVGSEIPAAYGGGCCDFSGAQYWDPGRECCTDGSLCKSCSPTNREIWIASVLTGCCSVDMWWNDPVRCECLDAAKLVPATGACCPFEMKWGGTQCICEIPGRLIPSTGECCPTGTSWDPTDNCCIDVAGNCIVCDPASRKIPGIGCCPMEMHWVDPVRCECDEPPRMMSDGSCCPSGTEFRNSRCECADILNVNPDPAANGDCCPADTAPNFVNGRCECTLGGNKMNQITGECCPGTSTWDPVNLCCFDVAGECLAGSIGEFGWYCLGGTVNLNNCDLDGTCDAGEYCGFCADCSPCCGDGACGAGETHATCSVDCPCTGLGSACTNSLDCCSGYCDGTVCAVAGGCSNPPGSCIPGCCFPSTCGGAGITCCYQNGISCGGTPSNCCSGYCNGAGNCADAPPCTSAGSPCVLLTECCPTNNCGNELGAKLCCKPIQDPSCTADNQCCSTHCAGGKCCRAVQGSCTGDLDCCSPLVCSALNKCCAPLGQSCGSSSDCCSGFCDGTGKCSPCNNNFICEPGETFGNCANDCRCNNDGTCEPTRGETFANCDDCVCNNNGACEPGLGETHSNCPTDCVCNGDGTCNGAETFLNCPSECFCITNGVCEIIHGETHANCPLDCGCVPNGACEPGLGETHANCPTDCPCNLNGVCEPPSGERQSNCLDCRCGDNLCNPIDGENAVTCLLDCHCPDGICQDYAPYSETPANCAQDCGCNNNGVCQPSRNEDFSNCRGDCPCDSNNICEPGWGEDFINCRNDCPCNNDGTCEPGWGEDFSNCLNDCHCPDGSCDAYLGEDCSTCPADCGSCCSKNLGDSCSITSECCAGICVPLGHSIWPFTGGTCAACTLPGGSCPGPPCCRTGGLCLAGSCSACVPTAGDACSLPEDPCCAGLTCVGGACT